jgi:hypothetical protein
MIGKVQEQREVSIDYAKTQACTRRMLSSAGKHH